MSAGRSPSHQNFVGTNGESPNLTGHNPSLTGDTETQELTWQLLDGSIDEGRFEKLESLLKHNEASRQQYINIVQVHSDLQMLFGDLPTL